MNTLILKIRDIESLNKIQDRLTKGKSLTEKQTETLLSFLSGLPIAGELLSKDLNGLTPFDLEYDTKLWCVSDIWPHLEKWLELFSSFPGLINQGAAQIAENDLLTKENVIIEACFAPSMLNEMHGNLIDILLKADGTVKFLLHTADHVEQFPELYHFKGTWKEAYVAIMKIILKGWPQEKFPKELEQFLSKID